MPVSRLFTSIRLHVFLACMLGAIFFVGCSHSVALRDDHWQNDIPPAAILLKKESRSLVERKEYSAAIVKLEESLKIHSNYYAATYNLALAYALRGFDPDNLSRNDSDRAKEFFEKALDIAKRNGLQDAELHYAMSWFAFFQVVFWPPTPYERGTWHTQYMNIEAMLKEALRINSYHAPALVLLGTVSELRGDLEQALIYYGQASDLHDEKGKEQFLRLKEINELIKNK